MDQHLHQSAAPDIIGERELEDWVQKLRKEGKTFKEIGIVVGVPPHKARYLFLRSARHQGKPPSWTDGLNDRLATSLHWLGFEGREDVEAALKSGHLQTLSKFERGLRGTAIAELLHWLGSENSEKHIPGKNCKDESDCSDPSKNSIRPR